MNWKQVTLGEVSSNIQTGPFGSQLQQSDYSESGTPVVMPKDLISGKISESSIARVEEQHITRLSRHIIENGDILYSRRGDVGRCAFATEKEAGWLCGTGCLRVTVNPNKADKRFVFFQLQQPETVGWVENHAVGSTMLNLNTSILSNVPISLPDINTQRRIADILSAYDDLIENNRKQIKLLEEAAQRPYKEWFVDLRFPGWETTEIVDGVPVGWRRGFLKELINVNYGKDHKKAPDDGNIPVYGSGGLMRKCNKSLYTGEAVLIPRKGSLNHIMYVNEAFWTVDTMFYATMKQEHTALFVYFFVSSYDMYSMNIGAAVPSMTVKILDAMDVLIPTAELLEQYDSVVQCNFERIGLLSRQNEMLAEARDRLLPKLMSGELEV